MLKPHNLHSFIRICNSDILSINKSKMRKANLCSFPFLVPDVIHSLLSPGVLFPVMVVFNTLFYKFSDSHGLQVPTAEVLSPSPNPGHTTAGR